MVSAATPSTAATTRPSSLTLPLKGETVCDCHVHVFDPARFPYAGARSYTPASATTQDLRAFHERLGIGRMVLVQPSVYGTDNRALVDALRVFGPGVARGIAVVDATSVRPDELQQLHDAGVRGLRLNLEGKQPLAAGVLAQIRRLESLLAPLGWSLQMYLDTALLSALAGDIATLSIPVVLDHFGGLKVNSPSLDAEIDALLKLLENRHINVKLSAPYRTAATAPDYPQAEKLARALVATAPGQLVWASDWPHTSSSQHRDGDLSKIEAFRPEDAGRTLSLVAQWLGGEAAAQVLVRNPQTLYGFTSEPVVTSQFR
ncbi:MAG: hypothetical protein EOO28_03645 [Comamonadaceae bacterium]|nr:MAG: hypothetical protein EOO28_03645 [Comamonadaceae bacterium]